MNLFWRALTLISVGLLLWQMVILFFQLPPYILPTPFLVMKAAFTYRTLLLHETIPTLIETLLGFLFATVIGSLTAILMAFVPPLGRFAMPIFIMGQAIPTFALAPLLVIWLGFGMASKIVTTILMLFFPITSSLFDGLQQTKGDWLDLAKTMYAKKWRTFYYIRFPAAFPSLASGLRIAAAWAPIGAVIGEWVGASAGLGFLMLNANARMQIDLMFAALLMLMVLSLALYFIVGQILKWAMVKNHLSLS